MHLMTFSSVSFFCTKIGVAGVCWGNFERQIALKSESETVQGQGVNARRKRMS